MGREFGVLTRRVFALLAMFVAVPSVPAAYAAVTPPPDPLTTQQQSARCLNARGLLDKGYLTDSEAAFKALLGRAPCAAMGIDDAKAAIARKAEQDAKNAKAADTLPPSDLVKVKALRDAGFETDARNELQKLVAAHPYADVPDELRAPEQRLGRWQDVLGSIGPWVRLFVELAIAALAAVATGLVVKNAAARVWSPSIRLGDVAGIPDEQTAGTTAELQDALGRLSADGIGTTVRTSAAEPDHDIPDAVTTAFPQAPLIAGLFQIIDRLLPRRLITVAATMLEPNPSRGMALSIVVMDRAGEERARTTVSEAQFGLADSSGQLDEAARRQRLIAAGAVWLSFCEELGGDRHKQRLGTSDWASYAWFALGEIEQIAGRRTDAIRLYAGALDRDANNVGALINLGAALLRPDISTDAEPISESSEQQLKRLRSSRQLLQQAAGRIAKAGRDWTAPSDFRGRYLLAVCDLYLLQITTNPAERTHFAREAVDCTQLLLEKAKSLAYPKLQPFLHRLRQPARVVNLLAQLELGVEKPPDLSGYQSGWQSTDTLYNLACLYARWVFLDPPKAEAHRVAALSCLETAIGRSTAARSTARTDPGLRAAFNTDPRFATLVAKPEAIVVDASEPQLLDVTVHLGGRKL